MTHTIIPITQTDEGTTAVLWDDLHAFLGIKARYNDWFPRMAEYGFEQGKDYVLKNEYITGANNRQYTRQNHLLTMDMAKHVAMIQRTDKGMQARAYFIEVEKEHRAAATPTLPGTYVEALESLIAAEKEKLALEEKTITQAVELEITRPKVESYNLLMDAEGAYSVGTVAKMLDMGRTTFFQMLRDHGIFITQGNMRNTPKQQYAHHFKVRAQHYTNTEGRSFVTFATHILPSGVDFLSRKFGKTVEKSS